MGRVERTVSVVEVGFKEFCLRLEVIEFYCVFCFSSFFDSFFCLLVVREISFGEEGVGSLVGRFFSFSVFR